MSEKFKEQLKVAMSEVIKNPKEQTVIMAGEEINSVEKFSQKFIAIKPVIADLINDIKNIIDSELAVSAEGFNYNRTELHDYLKNYTDDNLFSDDIAIALMSKIANELDYHVASKYYFAETEKIFKKRWQEERENEINIVESDKHFEDDTADDIDKMLEEF